MFIEGDKKEYSITYILSSDVKRIIVFEDSSIDDKDKSDKENIDDNIDLNMNETDDKKLKEINKLKSQLENEKVKLKQLVKKIIELESEMNEDKN